MAQVESQFPWIYHFCSGVEMDQEKIKTVLEWDAPETVKNIQSFLGFANFYRRIIEGYSTFTCPLTDLTKKSEKFFWSTECDRAFQELKSRFTSAPILRHVDPYLHGIIECDALDFESTPSFRRRFIAADTLLLFILRK